MKEYEEFIDLIGRKVNSAEVVLFLRRLGPEPEITEFENEYYYSFEELGIELRFEKVDDRLSTIFLYSSAALCFGTPTPYRQYRGILPGNVQFKDGSSAVCAKLGPPSASGGGPGVTFMDQPVSRWEKYSVSGGSVLIEYTPDQRYINMVTISKSGQATVHLAGAIKPDPCGDT